MHLAAWLHELVTLSGGDARDHGLAAISKLEGHIGGGFALAKEDAVPAAGTAGPRASSNPMTSATVGEPPKSKLAVLWDALAERLSWQKVFGVN